MLTIGNVLAEYEESCGGQNVIADALKRKFPSLQPISAKALYNKVKTCAARAKRLKRRRSKDYERLLLEPFGIKSATVSLRLQTREQVEEEGGLNPDQAREQVQDEGGVNPELVEKLGILQREVSQLKEENEELKAKQERINTYEDALVGLGELTERVTIKYDQICNARNEEQIVTSQLKEQFSKLQSEYEKKEKRLETCEDTMRRYAPRNLKRREQRHIQKIEELKLANAENTRSNKDLCNKISQLEKDKLELQDKLHDTDVLMTNQAKLQKRCSEQKKNLESKNTKYSEELNAQWKRVKELEKENKEMQQLVDLCEGETTSFFHDGKYTDALREVVISLLNLNIAIRNISPAIKVVIDKLTHRTVDQLPSYGTIHHILYEAKCLALMQAGRDMLKDAEEKRANILLNDGTTKRKRKYNATCVSTSTGVRNISLGIMASETSESLLKHNIQAFKEVAELLAKLDGSKPEDLYKQLLLSIKGTMSDRAEVMKKFNRLLGEHISGTLTDEQKERFQELQHHYCFLHVIINLGDNACQTGLVDLDNCTLTEESLKELHKRNQSSTYSAIYQAARLFHQMGSEVYGKSSLFEAFIAEAENPDEPKTKSRKGTQILAKHSHFEREVGNRAHITFHNANALYYHKDAVEEFITLHTADGTANEAMKQLQYLLNSSTVMAGARALGIIKCCLTGPFQSAFDQKCTNIMDMIPFVIEMRASMQELIEDAGELLRSPRSGLASIPKWETDMTGCLFEDSGDPEFEALTVMAIHLILSNQLILFERQCEMYLPTGEFGGLAKSAEDVRNCPITNRHCEGVMGSLDRDVINKPNATPHYIEALSIMKTGNLETHFSETEDAVKQREFSIARKAATSAMANNKERLKEYVAAQKAIMKQKDVARHNKKVKETVLKSKIISEISKFGGEWKSKKDVEDQLEKITGDRKRRTAIEWQIRYHKTVLGTEKTVSKEQKSLFKLTNIPLPELTSNLNQILDLSPHLQHLADLDSSDVVITGATALNKEERQVLYQKRLTALREKLQKQRQERAEKNDTGTTHKAAKPPAERRNLDIPSPASLIGQQIAHTFRIVRDGAKRAQNLTFTGTVLRIVKRAQDPLYTLFEIAYGIDQTSDSESDSDSQPEIFQCELLVDFVNGDARLLLDK